MQEPHSSNPADMDTPGSPPPLSFDPSAAFRTGRSPGRHDLPTDQKPLVETNAADEVPAATEGSGGNEAAVDRTIVETKDPNHQGTEIMRTNAESLGAEDKLTSTSQGLASLDLEPHTDLYPRNAPLYGQLEGPNDPFPLLQPSEPRSPDFSTYFDPPRDDGPPKIRAFAKIEFEDGQYYINTYAVELGRDVRAAKRAQQRHFHREVARRDRRRRGSDSSDEGVRHGRLRYPPSSAVSESGGIVNFESLERRPRKKSKGKKSTSPSSSSFGRSRNNSTTEANAPFDYQALAYEQLIRSEVGPAADPASYVPSPEDVPLIPVHPPNDEDQPGAGYTGISRRHARIAYNFDTNGFELEILGKNGGFVDEIWLDQSEVASLDHGSKIQISGVMMIFLLPNRGHTGTENTAASEAVSAMSFEFEDGRGDNIPMLETSGSASSEDLPVDEGNDSEGSVSEGEDETGHLASGEDSDDSEEIQQSIEEDVESKPKASDRARNNRSKNKKEKANKKPKIKLKLKTKRPGKETGDAEKPSKSKSKRDSSRERERGPNPEPSVLEDIANRLGVSVDELPTRRKGPGRPPKDGVMSKREYAQLVRQQKERQRAEGMQNGTTKSAKAVNGTNDTGPVEKRKYTKRKRPEDGEDPNGVREPVEGGEDGDLTSPQVPKPTKEKRPPKPPRSPSPEINEASLTEEQLAKPTQSYVVLIHEALSNSPLGRMSLPQIYKAIERRYPYYRFKVTTQGWQSSVRHNLSQHAAFRKIEKDGKGWMWGLVPEVSIEKEKKRRPTPPTASQQTFHPSAQNQPFRPTQYTYAPGPLPSAQTHPPNQMSPSYLGAARGYSATIPDVARTYGGALPPAPGHGASTYLSPYTPAPSAPVQGQTRAAYMGGSSGAPPHVMANPYYTGNAQSSSAPTTSSGPSANAGVSNDASVNSSTTFSTSRPDVPQPMLDACGNFKSKLVEHVGSSAELVQTIDRALNRALASVMNGEASPPATEDHDEMIFVREAHKALRGIWISQTQSKTANNGASMPAPAAAAPSENSNAVATDHTSLAESPSQKPKDPDGTSSPREMATTNTPVAPLEQHQQAPILNLLQQLDQNSDATAEINGAKGGDTAQTAIVDEATPLPTQHSEVMTASRDAAKKAINALNVSTKRGHDEEEMVEGADADSINDTSHNLRRPSKRVAVG